MSAAEVVQCFFDASGIQHRRVDDTHWIAELAGEHKSSIPIAISLTGQCVEVEAFFMRRPQENQERFYELLLRRNTRAYAVSFALDEAGDVYLVGRRAIAGLDEDEMDRIVGSVLVEADGLFDAAVSIGFASYLEADLRWRATRDAEANIHRA
ncbi:MAG: YbjN domain-containing protein [Actinomycetota bacterium]